MGFFFIQMADPQFGMFASVSELNAEQVEERRSRGIFLRVASERIVGFSNESSLYELAIEHANRLRPEFVVICGDMVHDSANSDQLAEIRRITSMLSDDIPIYWVPGNHDVGDVPTSETLAGYRERFGDDSYSFDHGGSHFVVINSGICFNPVNVPDEWEALVNFLKADLASARSNGIDHAVVFTHHPLFLERADEDDSYFNIPMERRRILLDIFKSNGVSAVFAGHLHRNSFGTDGDLQMVTTGPIGYPLGDDPSGFRIVKVLASGIEHDYFGLDDVPGVVQTD